MNRILTPIEDLNLPHVGLPVQPPYRVEGGASRGGHRAYYLMADADGVGRALRVLGDGVRKDLSLPRSPLKSSIWLA